jgi:hypothetical protein
LIPQKISYKCVKTSNILKTEMIIHLTKTFGSRKLEKMTLIIEMRAHLFTINRIRVYVPD